MQYEPALSLAGRAPKLLCSRFHCPAQSIPTDRPHLHTTYHLHSVSPPGAARRRRRRRRRSSKLFISSPLSFLSLLSLLPPTRESLDFSFIFVPLCYTAEFTLPPATPPPHATGASMAPDLNSLPPSRSVSGSPTISRAMTSSGEAAALRGQSPSPLSRSTTNSLQAAATVNAGLYQEESRRMSCLVSYSARLPTDRSRRLPQWLRPPKSTAVARREATVNRAHESAAQRPRGAGPR
jgi:hypothetical protein